MDDFRQTVMQRAAVVEGCARAVADALVLVGRRVHDATTDDELAAIQDELHALFDRWDSARDEVSNVYGTMRDIARIADKREHELLKAKLAAKQ